MPRAVHYLSPHDTRTLQADDTPGSELVAVVDYADEAYVLATVPIMRGRDATLLRRRRLEREFPGATLTAMDVLRRRPADGVTDTVMIAVNGGQALQDALAALAANHAVRAVTTPALLVAEWLRRARVRRRHVLVVLPTPAGVRLVFLQDGRVTLSRLTASLAPASASAEIARTVQYLQTTQRVERGEDIDLWFWGVDDATAAACVPGGTAVRPGAAPRVAGLPDPERDGVDALLALAARSPGRLQLARDELRLGWLARRFERSGRIAAAAAVLVAVCGAALLEWRASHLNADVAELVARRAAIDSSASQLDATLAQRGLTLAEVATLPEARRALSRGALAFDDVLATVGRGFAVHPDVRLQRVAMRAAPADATVSNAFETGAEPDAAAGTVPPDALPENSAGEACNALVGGDAALVEVEFGLAAGLDVRRRDAALGAVRSAASGLRPWRAGAAARSIGRRDVLVATDDVDAAGDAARWSVCLRREGGA